MSLRTSETETLHFASRPASFLGSQNELFLLIHCVAAFKQKEKGALCFQDYVQNNPAIAVSIELFFFYYKEISTQKIGIGSNNQFVRIPSFGKSSSQNWLLTKIVD